MRYFPYGLAQVNEERFASAVRQGYLAPDVQGIFRATEKGRSAAGRLIQAGKEVIVTLNPMPKESLQALGDLLGRIASVALGTSEPHEHILIEAKRDLYQRMSLFSTLGGFISHCLELEGFRDDCHIATWRAYRVEGHAWEMLDILSRGEPLTFAELHQKLSRRGMTEAGHTDDVQELAGRGWVQDYSGIVYITSQGELVQAEVEAETERLFFAPWSCLSEAGLGDLASVASQLRDGLKTKGE